ncbi:MAG: HEAT repeat domain-containing protein [Planctomycetota bacterium]|jgi:pimeloyl-ACP methyl ester carboxylesterase
MRTKLLCCLAFVVLCAPTFAQSDSAWEKAEQDFKDDFKKKSIKFKRRAIKGLPTNDGRTIEFIIDKKKLFNSKDWYIRFTAAERLAKIRNPDLRKKMLKYAEHRDKRVRECIMAALAINRDPKLDPPVIVKALSDSAWEVRRMACWAAGEQRVREAVVPMISMIHQVGRDGRVVQEGETNRRVRSVLLYNLEEITGKYFHDDVEDWKQYWERNKDRELPPVRRYDVGNFGDVELKFNDTFARRGSGPLVIVLPQTLKLATYYMPYFNQWLFVKWLFINLPPVTSFPDVQYNEHNDPIYPVDLLVDAFEEARKKYNVEKCAVLAQGMTCWVAAKYAQKYPDRVSGMILLNPYASNETYSKRIEEAKRSGHPDDEFWAKVSSYEIKAATTAESEVYDWFRSSTYVYDKSDIELGVLRRVWRDPQAVSIQVPPFDIRGENTSKTPVLMFFSRKNNKLTGYDDINRLKRFFPRNITVKLKKSARFPFMEEPALFEKALRAFVDKYLE